MALIDDASHLGVAYLNVPLKETLETEAATAEEIAADLFSSHSGTADGTALTPISYIFRK